MCGFTGHGAITRASTPARAIRSRIVVKPDAMLSLQKHFRCSEHWVVVRGMAEDTIGSGI